MQEPPIQTTKEPDRQLFVLDRDQIFFALISLVQILVFGVLYLTLLRSGHPKLAEPRVYFWFFLAVPFVTLIGWGATSRASGWRRQGIAKMLPWLLLLVAAPAAVLAAGLININWVIYYSYDAVPRLPPFSDLRFALGAGLGALLFFVLVLADLRDPPSPGGGPRGGKAVMWLAAIVLLLALYDPYILVDTLSYSPYVGAAFAMRHGAIPMVDTFSQYGPNFVLFAAAFTLAQTFYMASAIVSLLNVVMGLVFVSIITRLGSSHRFALAGGTLTVISLHAAFLYNLTYTPSVFAMRFLPPLLLVASLVRIPPNRLVTVASGLTMALSSLWSIEAFISALAVYGVWLSIRAVGERRPWRRAMRDAGLLVLLALAPHALWTFAYLVAFGTPPRYDIYFELVFLQLKGTHWLMPIEAGVYAWILFGFVYGSALALAGYKALASGQNLRVWSGVAAISVAGVMQFYYYVARSATPILVFVAMPLMLLALLVGDWAIDRFRMRQQVGIPVLAPPALAASLVLFVFMAGTFADRFFEPIARSYSNATLLRSCLLGGDVKTCDLRRIARLVTGADLPSGQFPVDETGGSNIENKASFDLIQRLVHSGNHRILLFGTDPLPAIFYSPPEVVSRIIYPPYAIGIVTPQVDGLSPTLSERALATLNQVAPGDVLIRGALPIYDLDRRALAVIESRWRLCPLAKLSTVDAFILQTPNDGTCNRH